MNYGLWVAIAAVFAFEVSLGRDVFGLVQRHGFLPEQLEEALAIGGTLPFVGPAHRALSSLFLHAGWFHVIGNLLYLRVFGDNVEDRFGHVGYLAFYVAGGFAGLGGHYLADPTSAAPLVGASGAIAAVLGAYIVLFPLARVVTLFPIFIFLTFIEVPAVGFLVVWCAQQLLNGYLELQAGLQEGIPWHAHAGGFGFGVLVGGSYRLVCVLRSRADRAKEKRSKPPGDPRVDEPGPPEDTGGTVPGP